MWSLETDNNQLTLCVRSHFEKNIDGLVQDCSNSSALAMELLQYCTKPLIYYQMLSFPNTGLLQVVENLLHAVKEMFILLSQCPGCWWPGDTRSQVISSHGLDLVLLKHSVLSTQRFKLDGHHIYSKEEDLTPLRLPSFHKLPHVIPARGQHRPVTLRIFDAKIINIW